MSIKIAAMAGRLFMGGGTTEAERTATAASGLGIDEGFAKKSSYEKDDLVFATEELAAGYVVAVGVDNADPRAVAVFKAGQKAGRIDGDGQYIGPTSSQRGESDDEGIVAGLPKGTQTAKDPSRGENGCSGPNGCGGLTAVSKGRLQDEQMDPELATLMAALAEGADGDEDSPGRNG